MCVPSSLREQAMHEEPTFPFFSNQLWILGFFSACLLIAHITLIRVWKLDKVGWKKVDYIWLGMAALGLLSAAAEVRRLVATGMAFGEESYTQASYGRVLDRAAFLSIDPGAICRTFVRSEFSPSNLDEVQEEFDAICRYGKSLVKAIPMEPPEDFDKLRLPNRPKVKDAMLLEALESLDGALEDYREAKRRLKVVEAAKDQTDIELALVALSPLLLSIALAVRITKVTGEILLEKETVKPGPPNTGP